jgi:predicted secreted protein
MPTTGVVNATDIGVHVGGTKIAEITSATLSLTHSPRDTTSNDSGSWTTRAKGRRDWEMSGNSLFRFDAGYGFHSLFALYLSGASVSLSWKTADAGDKAYTGNALLTSLQASGNTDENETYSFTFQANGAIA